MRLASGQNRWGSFSAPPDSLAVIGGGVVLLMGRGKSGRRERKGEGKGQGKGGEALANLGFLEGVTLGTRASEASEH